MIMVTTPVELDVAGALKRVGGDRELLARIIEFVIEDSPAYVRQIGIAVDDERYSEVERASHSLKGLVSNLQCQAVQAKALEIEGMARRHDRNSIVAALGPLQRLTEQMIAKLDAVLGELQSREDETAQGDARPS